MNLTNEHVEMIVERAATVARDTQTQPSGALRPEVLLLCAEVKTLAEKYVELIDDAGVMLKENDRLRNIEAAAKDIAGDADLMDDPNGWYGYAIGVGQYDRLKAACDG